MRRAGGLLLLAAALALAGCPEGRGYTLQRVPTARVPAAEAVALLALPPPPGPEEPPAATSGR